MRGVAHHIIMNDDDDVWNTQNQFGKGLQKVFTEGKSSSTTYRLPPICTHTLNHYFTLLNKIPQKKEYTLPFFAFLSKMHEDVRSLPMLFLTF